MKKHIKFPSIDQFKTAANNIILRSTYIGRDENGDPIYDRTLPKPTLKFFGTIKLHGTNSAIAYCDSEGIWAQSRENIITPEEDNAGFARYVETNKSAFLSLVQQIKERHNIDTSKNIITVFFEWAGKGIQKGVGINNIEKAAFIIGVKVVSIDSDEINIDDNLKTPEETWVSFDGISVPESRIFNILNYPTYEVEVNFNYPELSVNNIIDMTIEVEKECPVSKAFGFPNEVGEGIVFTTFFNGKTFRFKSKGELHSKSKVKTLNPVDNDKINKLISIAEQVTPEWRLEQMLSETCNLLNGGVVEMTKLGDYLKALMNDVIKEEQLLLQENEIQIKDVAKYISNIGKTYFIEQFNKF